MSLQERFPRRAVGWKLRTRELQWDRTPLLMGIVNVTPDSFSDGGQFFANERAIEQGVQLAEEGADILDIGGESTRPYSEPVAADEEIRRVQTVVRELAQRVKTPLSIDTSKAAVAAVALEAGAEIINDVTGLTGDPGMTSLAVESGAGVCVMHMQGNPQTMQDDPRYDDVVREIGEYLKQRFDAVAAAGVLPERICLDPGIGFGKTHQHNLRLLAQCGQYHELGQPLLVGHSRKGFIAKLIGGKNPDPTFGTLGVSLALARQGIQILRVHDVRANRQALDLFAAAGGIDGVEQQLS